MMEEPREENIAQLIRRMGLDELEGIRRILGAANTYREGDFECGLGASDDGFRRTARDVIANTTVGWLKAHPPLRDIVQSVIEKSTAPNVGGAVDELTIRELKEFFLRGNGLEYTRNDVAKMLNSDVIACLVKVCDNAELTTISNHIWNALPGGSCIGKRGYLSARVQPNSPTDDLEDILMSVLAVMSVGVGDLIVGVNPVSSHVESVLAVELMLKNLLATLGLSEILPHCVLSHLDVQVQAENLHPKSTAIWFQSIAGTQGGNATYGLRWEKLRAAMERKARDLFAMYFETGQGAEFTNLQHGGVDMVTLESRKFGLVRALMMRDDNTQQSPAPWVHVNDVAGFIGPEVYRTTTQLVRCCLEDIVMGKLHGLTVGCDVCATLHMDVPYDDLDDALDEIVAASPAYLMALPTRLDCMLGYLSTACRDHVRLRQKFGLKIDPRMQNFFEHLLILDSNGNPAKNWGRLDALYLFYRRRCGDLRPDAELLRECDETIARVKARGVFLIDTPDGSAEEARLREIDAQARRAIFDEWPAKTELFGDEDVVLYSCSKDRRDYVYHPPSGERLADASVELVRRVAMRESASPVVVVVVVSDGLNVNALLLHAAEFLRHFFGLCADRGLAVLPRPIFVRNGRVRAGYHLGSVFFGAQALPVSPRCVIHCIGERPGSGTDAFSAYITAAQPQDWSKVDHHCTQVVAGISNRALAPSIAAVRVFDMVTERFAALVDQNT